MTVSKNVVRAASALAVILALAGCGGKEGFTVNGTITGLAYDGLVLSTNGMDLPVKGGATSFSFPNSISYGDVYNVVQKTAPAHQNCVPTDQRGLPATDSAGHTAGINIIVSCSVNAAAIGGTVTGLTTDGLVLTNGTAGGTVTIPANAASYKFPTLVAYSQSYGVTILTQPAGAVCSVQNPAGVMGDPEVTNINVTCTPNT